MRRLYGWRPGSPVLGALLMAVAVAAAACSGSDSAGAPVGTVPVEAPTTVEAETTVADASTTTTSTTPEVEDGPLADVCPATIAIQTASLPGPAVGSLYRLLGPEPIVDLTTQRVSAPLVRVDGTVEDVVLEIRSGGPAVGFRSPLALLAEDPGLMLAQVSTAVAARDAAALPSVGVVTLTDRSHDALIVDPATHPGVETVEAVRDAGIEVRHLTKEPFILFLAASGSLSAEQLISGFDGEPAAFVRSGGTISQQGDVLVEPVLLPTLLQWGQPVIGIAAASAGWDSYDDALVARPADLVDHEVCLGRLVPVIQQAIAAYPADPGPTNVAMANLRSQFAPLARLTPELMDAGVASGRDAGVFGGGASDTIGDFDIGRLDAFLPEWAAALGAEELTADQLSTNEFIDPTITSAG